jgi:hypothetical protein
VLYLRGQTGWRRARVSRFELLREQFGEGTLFSHWAITLESVRASTTPLARYHIRSRIKSVYTIAQKYLALFWADGYTRSDDANKLSLTRTSHEGD